MNEYEKQTIAILPNNTNTNNIPTVRDENALNMVDYSDKTFIVFGEATKTYKEQMKDLGGKFMKQMKERPGFAGGAAWMFFMKLKPQVIDFVNSVNNRQINQHEGVTHQDTINLNVTGQLALPTVIAPIHNATYQTVHWKVYKPVAGMSVTIKAGGASAAGEVLQVESHRNVVDTAYISLNGNTSKLVIINGYWQVHGYMVEHRVLLGKADGIEGGEGPEKTNLEKTKPYNYEDIANI